MTPKTVKEDLDLIENVYQIFETLKRIEKPEGNYLPGGIKEDLPSLCSDEQIGMIQEYKVNILAFLTNHLRDKHDKLNKRNKSQRRSRNR